MCNEEAKYLFDSIGELQPLDKNTENQLIKEYQESNNSKILDKLMRHNLKFVIKIANKYVSYNLDLNDLIQAGSIGLISAITDFDCSKNLSLLTYAEYKIIYEMQKYIYNDSNLIRVPYYKHQKDGYTKTNICDIDCYVDESFQSINIDDENDWNDDVQSLRMLLEKELTRVEYFFIIHYYGIFGCQKRNLHDLAKILVVNLKEIGNIKKNTLERCRTILLEHNDDNLDLFDIFK